MPNIAIYVSGDKIGDAVLKYPAIRALRHALPGSSKIIWITGNEPSAFYDQLTFLSSGLIDHFYINIDSIPTEEKEQYLTNTKFSVLSTQNQELKQPSR